MDSVAVGQGQSCSQPSTVIETQYMLLRGKLAVRVQIAVPNGAHS